MRQEDRLATDQGSARNSVVTGIPSNPSLPSLSHSRSSRQKTLDIALIDEFPLRRTSTLNLLRAHFREGAHAFASVAELQTYLSGDVDGPSGVVLCVGGHSVTEESWAANFARLRILLSSTPLVILSDREELAEISSAFRQGARGYIPTNLEPALAMEALRIVLAGGTFIPADVLLRSRRKSPAAVAQLPAPSTANGCKWPARQIAVLRLLIQGKANTEIARALTMDEGKVKIHIGTIMRRLGAANRTEAALLACRLGVVINANIAGTDDLRNGNIARSPFEPDPSAA